MIKNAFSTIFKKTSSPKLGKILIKMGALTNDELDDVIKVKNQSPDKLIGQIIIERGYTSKFKVNKALDQQRKESRLGQLLVSSGIIDSHMLEVALDDQTYNNKKLGQILVDRSYCKQKDINMALKFQKRDNRLGSLLVNSNYISEKQLVEAIKIQKQTGGLLGETLVDLNLISSEQLTDILLIQSRSFI